jgi:hypothetical protein
VTGAQRAVDEAIRECWRLRKYLRKNTAKQIWADAERRFLKAVAWAWFNNHRRAVRVAVEETALLKVDQAYQDLLTAGDRATTRARCLAALKRAGTLLVQLQSDEVLRLASPPPPLAATSDESPTFAELIADPKMQAILKARWDECVRCVVGGAPLAATVMMGGILEGLLLAKINQLSDKSAVFKATRAPRGRGDVPLKLGEWTLKHYIDVAHELGWISQTTKDVGEVVRDYRNFIHPQKQYSHGVALGDSDARILWEVVKGVIRQLL